MKPKERAECLISIAQLCIDPIHFYILSTKTVSKHNSFPPPHRPYPSSTKTLIILFPEKLIISKIYIYFDGTTFKKGKINFFENIKLE
jgi:hypothetical protein